MVIFFFVTPAIAEAQGCGTSRLPWAPAFTEVTAEWMSTDT